MNTLKTYLDDLTSTYISLSKPLYLLVLSLFISGCNSQPPGKASQVGSAIREAIAGDGYFEGIITTKQTSNMSGMTADELAKLGNGSEMKLYLKGEHSRLELPLGTTSIFNVATQVSYTVNNQDKTYYIFDPNKHPRKASQEKREDGTEPTITATGQTEVIAGYKCEHWVLAIKESKIDVCLAKDLKHKMLAYSLKDYLPSADKQWAQKLGEGYPMKMAIEINIGTLKTKSLLEVVKVEPMKLDDSLFAAPAEYKEVPSPFDKMYADEANRPATQR